MEVELKILTVGECCHPLIWVITKWHFSILLQMEQYWVKFIIKFFIACKPRRDQCVCESNSEQVLNSGDELVLR